MNYLAKLKQEGHDKDLCMIAVMEYFIQNPQLIHKDKLARIPFKGWRAKQNKYTHFSIDTVLRKTRKLAEIGLLSKDNLGTRHSTRYWLHEAIEGHFAPSKPTVEVRVREDGTRYAVLV